MSIAVVMLDGGGVLVSDTTILDSITFEYSIKPKTIVQWHSFANAKTTSTNLPTRKC
jgi:hypothetical protein